MSPSEEPDRTKALLELLYHVSRELATALDLRTVLQRVLYEAIQNVGGERCSVVVLDDAGKAMDATIVYGTQAGLVAHADAHESQVGRRIHGCRHRADPALARP